MQTERRRRLALRWGLLGLGVHAWLAYVVVRRLLDEPAIGSLRDLGPVLGIRMSQLKPAPWKSPWLGDYATLLVVMIVVVIGVLFVLGVRDALREKK